MDSIKVQDIVRHILKDEDKGYEMMMNLSLSDSVEVITKIIPELIKKANEKKNANDVGYFNSIERIYTRIIVDKFKKADHLWTVYCQTTSYPYMVDDDLVILYDYSNHGRVEKQLKESGYDVTFGIEDPETFLYEIGHMYRNGYKNVRFIDGKDNELVIQREEIVSFENFFGSDYVTNPTLQNALISFFQEYRRPGNSDNKNNMLNSRKALMLKALRNAEFMVPCEKEETEEQTTISHPYIDITEQIGSEDDEKVLALPVFTDGFEMEKCYAGQKENMLYKYDELLNSVKEIGAAGVVINALGISYYMPLDLMIEIAE